MKKLSLVLKLFGYFLIGNVVFNVFFSLTETIIVNKLGMNIGFFSTYINNFKNSLWIYTVIYFMILTTIYMYDIFSVKELNKKLQKVKERGNHQ